MYKKILAIGLVVVGIFFFNITKAQVDNVYMRYCDDIDQQTGFSLKKTIIVEAGEEKEICFYFTTASTKPLMIQYGFTESALNKANNQKCESDIFSSKFSKNFTNPQFSGRIFQISSDKPVMVKDTILAPLGSSGLQLGCMAYYVSEDLTMQAGQMFAVLVRKAIPLNLFVGSGGSIRNSITLLRNPGGAYSTDSKVKATIDQENNMNVIFSVKNDGNISQDVNISGKIYNFLGFEKDFSMQQKIAPGETKELVMNIGLIPSYKGFFTVKYTFTNTPSFDFEMVDIGEKDKIGGTLTGAATIYVFSRITLIIILVLLLILYKAFWPRRRIVQA